MLFGIGVAAAAFAAAVVDAAVGVSEFVKVTAIVIVKWVCMIEL